MRSSLFSFKPVSLVSLVAVLTSFGVANAQPIKSSADPKPRVSNPPAAGSPAAAASASVAAPVGAATPASAPAGAASASAATANAAPGIPLSSAEAPPLPPSPKPLSVQEYVASQPQLGCEYRSHVFTERHVVVACGAAGTLILVPNANSFSVLERRPSPGGAVSDFFEQGGAVWARAVEERAVQVLPGHILKTSVEPSAVQPGSAGKASDAPSDETGTVSSKDGAHAPLSGQVVSVEGRTVTISVGRDDGLKLGDRVAFFGEGGSSGNSGTDERSHTVVGYVLDARAKTAKVRVGFNENVAPEMMAQVTPALPTGSRVNPSRVTGVWELSALIRPGLSLGRAGGFITANLLAARRTEHWYFGASVAPLGIAGAREQELIKLASGHVFGAYDAQLFSAGIGLGVTRVNDTGGVAPIGSGLGVHELLRIGAVDGLNATFHTALAVFRSEIQFSSWGVQGQIGVGSDTWILVRGGGGDMGYGYGEIAVRAVTAGNGGPGTSFLEVGLGGSGSFIDACDSLLRTTVTDAQLNSCRNQNIAGPHLSIGMEWRL